MLFLNRIFFAVYYRFTFLVFYNFFLKESNSISIIISPIYITPNCIRLKGKVFIRNNARIEGVRKYNNVKYNPEIVFEDKVSIEQNVHITCAKRVYIGKSTAISANVTITDIDHPYTDINLPIERQNIEVHEVSIGSGCKIYNNVVMLPGSNLGNHIVVAANSVVLAGNYPDFCVLAGAPARIVKKYNTFTKLWEKV